MDLNLLKSFAKELRTELLKTVSYKIDYVLKENSYARRDNIKAVNELEKKVNTLTKERVVEQVAYTWFNRFTALYFMDINGFNTVKVIMKEEGITRPEILSDAISGVFDNNLISDNTQNIVSALLDGRTATNDPENEGYRLLIIGVCNKLNSIMPFLFERISDYTELLIPDDLLSKSSILEKIRDAMTVENSKDVEIIGWLYQFYISEKKDLVLGGLKNKQKVTPENIPAATQLFTPHWIVKYLVENSLGRLWMLNNPNSNLINKMEYYVSPEGVEKEFIKIISPEEIKICDPACGSGHLLTYSFDLLYLIYEEEGYDTSSIPSLILKNNLYGIELDKRAGELSAFALTMKARSNQNNFFIDPIQPNICVLENIKFDSDELNSYMNEVGRDLFTNPLQSTLKQFEESDNFGSLIQPVLDEVNQIRTILQSKDLSNNLFLKFTHERVLKVLNQSDYLRQKYHVVIANPPYMGSGGMNIRMSNFLKEKYKETKSDLFAAFIVRNIKLALKNGQLGFVTPFVWMFIPTYEKLRKFVLETTTINSLIQLEYNAFEPAMIPVCAFALQNSINQELKGVYIKLSNFKGVNNQAPKTLEAIKNPNCNWIYKIRATEFSSIPGTPIAYWLSKKIYECFSKFESIEDSSEKITKGIFTGKNERFILNWSEISFKCLFNGNWKRYSKAGGYRKYYGLSIFALRWKDNGKELKSFDGAGLTPSKFFGKPHICWSKLTSNKTSFRLEPIDVCFDDASPAIINCKYQKSITSYMNSNFVSTILDVINPTLNYQSGDIAKIVIPPEDVLEQVKYSSEKLIQIAKSDWDSYERSWDFKESPLISSKNLSQSLEYAYKSLRIKWRSITDEMMQLEEENNRTFLQAYGLKDEINPDTPIQEITLTCNPAYRYRVKVSEESQEERLCSDTIKEFISYSVGCMFGRYSLDKPGLILANQGETLKDYFERIPNPSFIPDDDNVIPILNLDWFEDDITARFRKFLKITFGDDSFEENIRFIETSIGKDIRKYFLNNFYKDHLQTYKNRPIYWMFSSPKGSFNALIYMHRYEKDTVSIILDKYLREFLLKLRAEKNTLGIIEISSNSSMGEKTRATKEIQKINSMLQEIENWEKEIIFPLASQRLEIDFDDGVKINYSRFATALRKISGLN